MTASASDEASHQVEILALRTRLEVVTAQRDRLMGENAGLIHEIKLLHERFTRIQEPASGRLVTDASPKGRSGSGPESVVAPTRPNPRPSRATPPTVEGLDL